jgi:D-alanyl-D-alanine carboxypeptidase
MKLKRQTKKLAKTLVALVLVTSFSSAGSAVADPALEQNLQAVLDSFIANNPTIPGVMVTLHSEKLNLQWQGAAGIADLESGQAIKPDQPLRLASTTKTYVAAAILRLIEQSKLEPDDAISKHLPANQLDVLKTGKYQAGQISIRHLLTHTSGLWDYAASEAYATAVQENPEHRWTRNEQLQFAMDQGEPYGVPGEIYHYSDTGYILLGEIIERRSGMALAPALRKLLNFDALNLNATWLESLEPAPESAPIRAHQYWGEVDTTSWDPSLDLYGGGGLVANMPDLARFFRALFDGEVFDYPATLAEMKTTIIPSRGGPANQSTDQGSSQYCLGISASDYRDFTIFGHGGFWGTLGAYIPALDLALGMAVTQQKSRDQRKELLEALLDVVIDA